MNLNIKRALTAGLVAVILSTPNHSIAQKLPDCKARVEGLAQIAQMVEDGYKSSGKRLSYPWVVSTNEPIDERFLDCLNIGIIDATKGQYYIEYQVKEFGNITIHIYCLDHVKDELCSSK